MVNYMAIRVKKQLYASIFPHFIGKNRGGVADESAKECKIYTSGGQINKMLPNRKNLHLQGFLCIAE